LEDRELLRHMLAVIAYRGGKTLRDAPASFFRYDTGGGRTPLDILAHVGDLMDWGLRISKGAPKWTEATPAAPEAEIRRFHATLEAWDAYLASGAPLGGDTARTLSGPMADALTHVGQLAILRRMAGAPTRGESYYQAAIRPGQVGPDQPPPVKPFPE